MSFHPFPIDSDLSFLSAMELAYQFELGCILVVNSKLQVDGYLIVFSQWQIKVCWNDLTNKFFHESLLLLEKSSQVVLKPCDDKSWFVFGVDNFLFGVLWQLFLLDIESSVISCEQTFLS
jgi:hypothetical protein